MEDIEHRVDSLLAAPQGCAFILAAHHSSLTPAQVVEPRMAFDVGAVAVKETEIWSASHERAIAQITQRAQALRGFAHEILAEPGASWWFAPFDRRQQLYVWPLEGTLTPEPSAIRTPDGGGFERYAQKPKTIWTSTLVGGEACMRVFIDAGAGDWLASQYPIPEWHMSAVDDARVFEINGPDDWHALCVRYPMHVGDAALNLESKWPDPQRLTVDWRAAADDWDAVHLTFGGMLASEQVPRATDDGWSVMWGWASEMTCWLRYAFGDVLRLPDHERHVRISNIWLPHLP